jgi:uncharacterized Zn finger protein (UPF0148 family)
VIPVRIIRGGAYVFAVLTVIGSFLMGAQAQAQCPLGAQPGSPLCPTAAQDPAVREAERKQREQANTERQKSLQNDTDKLLKLATELKQYVDKTDKNTLSLDVLRKAEEIEKLAKNVEKKMRADEYQPLPSDAIQHP